MAQRAHPSDSSATRPTLVVAVCTYQRNEPLARLLSDLVIAANAASSLCDVVAVIVDDSSDQQARSVIERLAPTLPFEIHYRTAGHQNISIARNIGLELGIELGDWVVMTDDDCAPDAQWLVAMVECQRRTSADAVTGRMVRRVPPGAPRWLHEPGILEQGVGLFATDSEVAIASTHNSMISAEWLRRHPDVRFDVRFGKIGGEDMVFYKSARELGLRIRYCQESIVYEDQPDERITFRFIVWQAMWLGNSSYVTSVESGTATRSRMLVHGLARCGRALVHPVQQLARRQRAGVRLAVTRFAGGVGVVCGALGVRLNHH